jgi:hypothetical protein
MDDPVGASALADADAWVGVEGALGAVAGGVCAGLWRAAAQTTAILT